MSVHKQPCSTVINTIPSGEIFVCTPWNKNQSIYLSDKSLKKHCILETVGCAVKTLRKINLRKPDKHKWIDHFRITFGRFFKASRMVLILSYENYFHLHVNEN